MQPSARHLPSALQLNGAANQAQVRTCLKRSRSSALSIEGSLAPMSSMPYLSRMPDSDRPLAVLRPVWPPIVGRMASGFSLAMICSALFVFYVGGAAGCWRIMTTVKCAQWLRLLRVSVACRQSCMLLHTRIDRMRHCRQQ